ncbi:hypothetical protein RN001_002860 [Aquatica leii]|uniref:Uncharacterized protein n=1 Tax=Aquatica leii TaxID=1421715 RepID=A0AAN7SM10_9COLE|nr:hypothetical protein RN001_002860 [Aquatica leii]
MVQADTNTSVFTVPVRFALVDPLDLSEIEFNINDEYDDSNHIRLRRQETTTVETTTNLLSTTESTMPTSTDFANVYNDTILPIIKLNDSVNEIYSEQIRFTRQEKLGKNKTEDKAREDDAEDEDDGGGGGLLGAIISGFLGSLSKPDGGVDINAVVNVIGSLSTLQENGTYDFSGLTNTLSAFFGGGEDGGGSDVGSFAGGLAAASIAGIASPPGADPSESNDGKPQEGDAGGFLFSLLNSLFGTPPSANEINYETDDRDKRAVGHVDPKYAIKNALLGFVFNKINSFIDQKTAWISQLDKINVAKNAAAGIHPPQDSIASISGAISGVIGQKLQAAGPLISIVTSKLTSGSLGGSSSSGGSGGFNLGSLLGGSGGGGASAQLHADPSKGSSASILQPTSSTTKRPTTTEDIVIFEKGKPASLELPSELFGSSFTLITKASTAVGDYMINSAIRLQRLLEVFRPVIRAAFGVKGFVSEVTTDKPIFSDSSSNE